MCSLLPPLFFWNVLCLAARGQRSSGKPRQLPARASQKQRPHPRPSASLVPSPDPGLQPDVGLASSAGSPSQEPQGPEYRSETQRRGGQRRRFHLARHFDIRPVSPAAACALCLGCRSHAAWEDCGKVLSGTLCARLTRAPMVLMQWGGWISSDPQPQ